jgi:hypothetical protein
MNLHEVANEINARMARLFLPDSEGRRPCHGLDARFASDPYWKDLVLFHEYFHGDDGRGLGASHQTGWTALVARCMEEVAQTRVAAARNGTAAKARRKSRTPARANRKQPAVRIKLARPPKLKRAVIKSATSKSSVNKKNSRKEKSVRAALPRKVAAVSVNTVKSKRPMKSPTSRRKKLSRAARD